MDNRLLCEITEDHIRTYEEDGVVVIRGAISLDWVEYMREAMERVLDKPGPTGGDINDDGRGRFAFETFMWLHEEGFKRLAHESPLGELAGRLMRSSKSHFLYDFFFSKEPHTPHATSWHQDQVGVCCHGKQVIGTWMPLDVVTRESGAPEYIRGSHKWDLWYTIRYDTEHRGEDYSKNYVVLPEEDTVDPAQWGETFTPQPDFEAERDKHDIVTFDSEPGDIVVNNLLLTHGAPGNQTERRRRAVGGRWVGDDAVFALRSGTANVNIPAEVDLKDGDPFPPDHPLFPQVWPPYEGGVRKSA